MKLFNKYQSRALQFALDLLAQLQSTALSTSQIQALAQQWGLDYADQVIQPLCRAGFLEQTADGYRLTADGTLPRLPLSAAERSTLAALLQIPESQLFLETLIRTFGISGCIALGTLLVSTALRMYCTRKEKLHP